MFSHSEQIFHFGGDIKPAIADHPKGIILFPGAVGPALLVYWLIHTKYYEAQKVS